MIDDQITHSCPVRSIRADVRLIGAAPDLLDVLIRMVEYADDGTPIHPTDNLMAEARAVVAQAVGAA